MDLAKAQNIGTKNACDFVLTKGESPEEAFTLGQSQSHLEITEKNEEKNPILKNDKKNVFGNGGTCDLLLTKGEKCDNVFITNKVSLENAFSNTLTQKTQKRENGLKTKTNISLMEEETFECKICNYTTNRKWSFNRHMESRRHFKKSGLMCKICEKLYETKSGLWKHSQNCRRKKTLPKKTKKCTAVSKEAAQTEESALAKVLMVILQNQQQQQKVQQDLIGTMNKMIPKIGNNNTTNNTINNNQKISIKVFLNDHCKDAINLKDFVKNIELTYDNLKQAVRNGGAEAISDVLVQKLTDMKPTERPIHCSDARRSHFYVKDKGKWARDNNTKKLDSAISSLARKQLDNLYKWTQQNPNWIHNAKLSNQWQEMTQEIAWTAEEARKYRKQIKRSLMKPTDLKEAMEITAEEII